VSVYYLSHYYIDTNKVCHSRPCHQFTNQSFTFLVPFFFFRVVCVAFPLLWVINVIIILQPLQIHPADEIAMDMNRCNNNKTEEERREELAIMRSIELRWARRSAIALAIFVLLLLILILVVVLRRRRG
jgi:hypothetical protein